MLDEVGLGGVGRRPVKAYSLGMRQRLGLAAALLRQPELLILDEPTNGLDPQGIGEIRQLLLKLHAAGTTIFLSSHLLAEVEQLCTRVGVLDRGRLIVQSELAELQAADRADPGPHARTSAGIAAVLGWPGRAPASGELLVVPAPIRPGSTRCWSAAASGSPN